MGSSRPRTPVPQSRRLGFAGKKALRNRLSVILVLMGIGLPSLWLAVEGVQIALATRLGSSASIAEMKKAVSLDPGNPKLRFRLGTAETYDLKGSDPSDGIHQLKLATRLSPHVTRYWAALAFACEFEDEMPCANHAISRSLALNPMTPQVRWEAASYYLRANQQELALAQFRRLLELDPGYAEETFQACLRATNSPQDVYRSLLTPASGAGLKITYIRFLLSHGHEKSAFQVWKELAASKSPFKFSLVDPYLENLIETRHFEQANMVWHDLEHRGVVKESTDPDASNLVFNGGFEHTPLNAGFGWRYRQEPYVAVNFDSRHAYSGKRCLEIEFSDVENHRAQPVSQLVPVEAGKTYEVSAYVRSDNITSDSGPRLRVVNPECPKCLSVSSSATVGTTPWHKISFDFKTGPKARVISLSVWRSRGLDFPAEILGTFWLDQVSIRAVPPASDQNPQRRRT